MLRRKFWQVFGVWLVLASSVHASDCDWVEALPDTFDMTLPKGGSCGAPDTVCQWAYDYRSTAAQIAFADLEREIAMCLSASAKQDAPVNHPDSYRLMQFDAEQTRISLSLKDKASLQKTFLFLRVDNLSD